jgi:hypothetical protein
VYYVASDQHVHQLYYNNSKWSDQDLTSIANGASAQPGISDISSFAIGDGQHVYYAASDYHVHQMYYNNSKWSDQNLTSIANGASAQPASGISSFAISDGQHVHYVASDQHVHQLYYDNSRWSDQDLTSVANGASAQPASGISSFAISDGQHVYYVASDQHVHQLYYNNSKWSDQDLTSIANGASAQPGIRGISSLASGDGQHVYFKSLSH